MNIKFDNFLNFFFFDSPIVPSIVSFHVQLNSKRRKSNRLYCLKIFEKLTIVFFSFIIC